MSSTKRQLTGVDEFLDWRPLEFVDEIPDALVCTICGVIAAFPKRILTCCHVFCPACYENITERERICPMDRGSFLSETVDTLDSSLAGLKKLRVRCPNSSRGCAFVGEVCELQQHFLEQCRLAEVQCPRCGTAMSQREALDHYLQHCSGRAAAKSGVVRKATSFELATVAPGGASNENSSRSSGGRSGTRRRKNRTRAKPSSVHKASSAETKSAAALAKDPNVAVIDDYSQDDTESSIRSVSGGSSKDPSHESSLITSSSEAKSGRNKTRKAAKSMDGVPKVPSQEKKLVGTVDSLSNNAQKPCSTAATGKQQLPSSSGACSTTSARKLTAGSPRNKGAESPRRKFAANVAPAGFAFSYVTALEDAESRLTCGEEVVLRSDSFLMADCSFRVHARLRRDKDGVVLTSFALCVCGGTWQKVAEWSLSTVVNLVLVHPWDQSRNMRLPLNPNPDSVPMPPGAYLGRWDFWSPTTELKLRDVKARGFVSSGSVCIAVEVE